MKAVLLTLSLLLFFSTGAGQSRPSLLLRAHPLRPSVLPSVRTSLATDTVRLLALMVQFKSDLDPRTSGNGSFILTGSPDQIDPPPHNAAFVAAKLRFLHNYFRKSSNGSLIVQGDVFSPIVTLADSMAAYSPQRAGSSQPLAQLIVDSWTAANALNPSFPFSSYDAFLLVHAGVGRDINVVSILGFDPTPFDLPSLSVDLQSLRELLNDPVYPGVPVNGGAFHITNTLILPETETRVFTSGNVVDTLQLGTNGLFAASLGSFLGLPDLFDTKTGRSGIGQFGLMDGASIFAYSGLFPPEPSAWEKIALGWVVPFEATGAIALPAVGLTETGQDSILKIPISASEYFLVENRSRDSKGDGQKLTIFQNGQDVTRFFGKDTVGFFFNDVRGITGVVVDVEDFDWAISGDMTQQGLEGGGVLLWHIDEDVIARNLSNNEVNADPLHRGVDLEEADGSQDIGQAYEFLQPGSGTEVGWPRDQWFSGNGAPPYRNIFNQSSFPDSRSNSGALSLVDVKNFGPKAPTMTFQVTVGSLEFQRVNGLAKTFGSASGALAPTTIPTAVIVPSENRVYVFQKNGVSKISNPSGLLSANGGSFPVAALEQAKTLLVGAQDSVLTIWDLDSTTAGQSASVTEITVPLGAAITAAPMILDSLGVILLKAGCSDGSVWTVRPNGTVINRIAVGNSPVTGLVADPGNPGSHFSVTASSLIHGSTSVALPSSTTGWILSGGAVPGGLLVAVAERGGKRIFGFDRLLAKQFEAQVSDGMISSIVVADADAEGRNDLVVSAGASLYAFNMAGILLDGFPLRVADGEFTGSPLVTDIDGDGVRELMALSTSGAVHGFGSNGRVKAGFPLQFGSPGGGSIALFETEGSKTGILATSSSGSLSAWERNLAYAPQQGDWTGELLNSEHRNFNPGPSSIPGLPVSGFLPKERVYNWPNPVYGSVTNIRFYTTEPAAITVKIFDLAGETVARLTGSSPGGIDVEIPWNVSGIQSGIYLARVEASTGLRSDAVVFKIAVVK